MTSVTPLNTLDQFSSQLRHLNSGLATCRLLTRQLATAGADDESGKKLRAQLVPMWLRHRQSLTLAADAVLPTVQTQQQLAGPDWKDWEARFATLLQIGETTADNLERSAALMKLADSAAASAGSSGFRVHTGIVRAFSGGRCAVAAAVASASVAASELPPSLADLLRREAASCRRLVERLQSSVLVAHWTVQHDSRELESLLVGNGIDDGDGEDDSSEGEEDGEADGSEEGHRHQEEGVEARTKAGSASRSRGPRFCLCVP